MEKSPINLPLIILAALPSAMASIYLLLQPNPILAVLPPLLIPIVLWLGHQPRHGFYLILIMIPFNAWRELMNQYRFLTLSKLIGLFLLGLLLVQVVEDPRRIKRVFTNTWFLLACFSVAVVVSTLYSAFPVESIDNLRMLVSAYLFFFLVLFFVGPEQLKTTLPYILAFSTVIVALIALMGYFFQIEALLLTSDPNITSGRVLGSASNPNLMAATLLVGIPFIVFFLFESRSLKGKLFWTMLFLISSGAIVLSYSRSMILVYGVLLIILLFDNLRRFKVRYTGFISVFAAILFIYGAAKIPETAIWERLASLSAPQIDTSLQRRASYFVVAKAAVKKHPVIGTGPGTFPFIYQHSSFAAAFAEDATGYARSAHNTYLEVVVGTGLIGLIFFLSIILYAFTELYRAHKRVKLSDPHLAALIRSIAWAFIAFLMALMFSSQIFHKYIWLLIGLSVIAGRVASSQHDSGNKTALP